MIHIIDLQFLNLSRAIASFLVKTDEGSILVETGPASTLNSLNEGIKNLGCQPEEIKHVFITHIHLDHAGAAWWFAGQGAKIYLHPKGVKHLEDPSRLINSARRIYQDQMDSLWGEMKSIKSENLIGVEDREVLHIGGKKLKAWHTPGHAIHHIAWQLEDKLFTGDVAGVKINNGPVVPPCPPPDINIEDWNNSILKIIEMPVSELYLTHFGKVDRKFLHLEQLKYHLNDWAIWIGERWKRGLQAEQIIPEFQAYVHGQLKESGVNENGIRQYEAANPSWMSVNGLIRYWEKKSAD